MLLRHLLSIAILPFTVTVLIPRWISGNGLAFTLGRTAAEILEQSAGLLVLVAGLLLFFSSLRRFATEGEGTLAPWDPPKNLVVRGPYRYVRNPMISGVILILFAEWLLFRLAPLLVWALTFLAINAVYIPLLEEPLLRRKFGASYEEYCRNVPRLLPRLTAWNSLG